MCTTQLDNKLTQFGVKLYGAHGLMTMKNGSRYTVGYVLAIGTKVQVQGIYVNKKEILSVRSAIKYVPTVKNLRATKCEEIRKGRPGTNRIAQ